MIRKLATTLALLLLVAFTGAAHAQDCHRGGCISADCSFLPLLDDPEFTGICNVWAYSGGVSQKSNGTCYEPNYAHFTSGYGTVYQDTVADNTGDKYTFNYFVTVENANGNPWSSLEVNLYDANTGQFLAHIDSITSSSALSCVRRDIDLGTHADWKGRTLRVRFDGYAYYSTRFRVENAGLWQSRKGSVIDP